MAEAASARTRHARALFAPLGETYDRGSAILSLGQDPRWRRFLVSRVSAGPGDTVLDVATGTGLVARELIRQKGCKVVGLDQSPEMLAAARERAGDGFRAVEGHAERLPFPDASFAAVTFTYLFRYVDDAAATLRELVRVVRPGGSVAALEFGLPSGVWRPLWDLYTGLVLPAAGRVAGRGWYDVGRFLRGSIRDLYAELPLDRQLELWRDAGIADVRSRSLSLGGGVVFWGHRGR